MITPYGLKWGPKFSQVSSLASPYACITRLIASSGNPYCCAADLSTQTVKKDGARGPFWVNVNENSFNLAFNAKR